MDSSFLLFCISPSLPPETGIFQVMFSIIAINFFQLQPEQNGYLMAYFGVMQMVRLSGVAPFTFP